MDLTTIASGLLGLAFFEGLRIYKCTSVGKHPVPNNRIGWHLLGLSILALVAASLAVKFASGEFVEGLILGFAVPSGLKAVLSGESGPDKGEDMWSDDASKNQMGGKSRTLVRAMTWINSYFDTRWRR